MPPLSSRASLHDLLGLDVQWWIHQISVVTDHTHPGLATVTVLALDRREHQLTEYEDVVALAEANGGLPVTEHRVTGVSLTALAECFGSISFTVRLPQMPTLNRRASK